MRAVGAARPQPHNPQSQSLGGGGRAPIQITIPQWGLPPGGVMGRKLILSRDEKNPNGTLATRVRGNIIKGLLRVCQRAPLQRPPRARTRLL